MNEDDIIAAIESGAKKAGEIADEVGKSRSNTTRYLKQYADDPESPIERYDNPNGNGFIYGLELDGEDVDAELPIMGDRDEYSWEQFIPDPGSTAYIQADSELNEIKAIIDAREHTGQLPRFRLSGPPGTGKTTLATHIAAERQWPKIPIQITASLRDSELFGSPHLIGGESVWVDGPLVRALLCSQERPVVVVLDEINRAPFHRKSSLQSVLDHRAQATIQLRGGEVIQGNPENLITVATMNEGPEYETYPIDPAEKRRHGNTWEVPYLGRVDAEREAELVAEETTISEGLAAVMVIAANRIRSLALDDQSSPIQKGIPTSSLLEWAKTTEAYRDAGLGTPVQRAARTAVIDPRYDDRARTRVESELLDVVREKIHKTGRKSAAATGD